MNHLVFRVFGIVLVVVINSEIGASVAYGGDCSSVACADTTTQTCIDNTCQCSTTHFRNNENTACEAKITVDSACEVADSGQCSDTNSECKDDGAGTNKCLCKTTHYDSSGTCTIRKKPEENCAANQCVDHATCDTTCKCDAGYTATPTTTPTMCSGVFKFATLPYMYVVPILVTMMFLLR